MAEAQCALDIHGDRVAARVARQSPMPDGGVRHGPFRYNPSILPIIMPATRASARAQATLPARALRVVRFLTVLLVAGFAAFCVLLLLLRHVVMPQIPAHRAEIAELLSRRIGAPIEIDAIATGWDGWNPKLVIDGFRVRASADAPSVLDLPHVELVAAWTSLPLLQLRLKHLAIERPALAVRRDADGQLHIAGMDVDTGDTGGESPFVTWLLRQREIAVHNAVITWTDDARGAPALAIEHVELRMQNEFGRHRFAATGIPPSSLASPIDVRGELSRASLLDWRKAEGELYLRLDYADVGAWRAWVALPAQIDSGQGALRVWLRFASGAATRVVADVELADVRAHVKPDLPELALSHLAGRLLWTSDGNVRTLRGSGLAFTTTQGEVQVPGDFAITITAAASSADARGVATFTHVDLAQLASIASKLPFPDSWREALAMHPPRGVMTDGRYTWQGEAQQPSHWSAKGTLVNIGVAAHDRQPTVANISGAFDVDDQKGVLMLAAHDAALELPAGLGAPVHFDRLDGQVRWHRVDGRWRVELTDVAFANADTAGAVAGFWQALPDGPGDVDLAAQFTRANVARVADYLPLSIPVSVRDWLRRALVKGNVPNAQVALRGNLADFPFAGGKPGVFTVAAQVHGGTLDYADGWPQVDAIDADVRIDRTHVRVEGARGTMLDTTLGRTVADVADYFQPLLTVDGSAAGSAPAFLQFVQRSPVAEWSGNATDGLVASGNGALNYKLALSLRHVDPTRLTGSFALDGGALAWSGVPPMTGVTGKFSFNEQGIVDGAFDAKMLGGAARIALSRTDGGVHIDAGGSGDFAQLRNTYAVAYADRLRGVSDWHFDGVTQSGGMRWNAGSSLQGASIDLPAPLAKAQADAFPLRIERRAAPQPGHDTLAVTLGDAVRLSLRRRTSGSEPVIERALLLAGTAVEKPGDAERAGLWIRADLPSIDIDDWLSVDAAAPAATAVTAPPSLRLGGIDLAAGRLTAMRRRFRDLNVSARRDGDNWQVALQGRDVEGSAAWYAAVPGTPNGRAVARLSRFALPRLRDEASASTDKAEPAAKPPGSANRWPELDVDAKRFLSRNHELGHLQVLAQPNGNDWRIDKLQLDNDGGRIAVSGAWHVGASGERTELAGKLDIRDAGAFLARFGYPDEIRAAPTQIEGKFAWSGAPSDFDYQTLNGSLHLKSGAGQFVKIDPGIGKLIGVLSLQALPRRITLDFRDIFSEGFAFDDADGDVRIVNGVLHTDAFHINGTAARVNIRGDADLAHETQQLDVRVQPSLATSFSAGTAGAAMLLLAANPVVAAVVGAGTFLAQKALQDPIEHIFSYEYRVTGSWTDPIVARVGRETRSAQSGELHAQPVAPPTGTGHSADAPATPDAATLAPRRQPSP
ncbi:MAG: YhdP family protein [Casimicrobiaceae bacterium]